MHRAARVSILLAAVALGGGLFRHARTTARPVGAAAGATRAPLARTPDTLDDPVSPGRPAALKAGLDDVAGDWVTARPGFQYSRSAAERGGIEPCATQTVDLRAFEDWVPLTKGRYSVPLGLDLDASGGFDLVIHLMGDDPVRRELVKSHVQFVLYTLTIPQNQSYAPLFTGSQFFRSIILGVEQGVGKRTGRSAHVRHVVLSAWSAGFVGIEAALSQPESKDVDAVVLIDGLHAPRRDRAAFEAQLKPFVAYAARAASGDRFMLVSHSSIDPPSFASTTECAHYLIASLGGTPVAVRRADPLGLELTEYFSRGNLHVRGYAGNDKADHCAQLGVLRDAFATLGRRFGTPPLAAAP